ncbi:hypothetical protein [Kitasatospora purpeofusca]
MGRAAEDTGSTFVYTWPNGSGGLNSRQSRAD